MAAVPARYTADEPAFNSAGSSWVRGFGRLLEQHLGYRPDNELATYGDRVFSVHVKDRLLGGTTVPLGTGDADLPGAFRALGRAGYVGDFILQTARADDGRHGEMLCRYRHMVRDWLAEA